MHSQRMYSLSSVQSVLLSVQVLSFALFLTLTLCISDRSYGCGSVILNASIDNGLIKSPDFDGDGLYENNLECSWTIIADIDKIVQLFIIEFQLEKDYWCRFDNLKVG